jgi:uncharacterized protein
LKSIEPEGLEIRNALTACLTNTSEGVVVKLRVQPRASKSQLSSLHGNSIKAKVTAPATEGRANEAVLDLLAKAVGIKRAQLTLVGGVKSRDKRILVQGMSQEEILDRLAGQFTERS